MRNEQFGFPLSQPALKQLEQCIQQGSSRP
jgi:hypothetical protein